MQRTVTFGQIGHKEDLFCFDDIGTATIGAGCDESDPGFVAS